MKPSTSVIGHGKANKVFHQEKRQYKSAVKCGFKRADSLLIWLGSENFDENGQTQSCQWTSRRPVVFIA